MFSYSTSGRKQQQKDTQTKNQAKQLISQSILKEQNIKSQMSKKITIYAL